MKSKLAVFDFDRTLKDDSPEEFGQWQMGVGHLFPGGKIPEDLSRIYQNQGFLGQKPDHISVKQLLLTKVSKSKDSTFRRISTYFQISG